MKNIIGISGSLRKHSFNQTLLRSVHEFIPEGFAFNIVDIGMLPLYNDDLAKESPPASVHEFRQAVQESAGILIASPEYNYSMSGVLKNALDWAATDTISNVMKGKPTAMMGASKTIFGTVRSQLHLRQVLLAVHANVVQHPEVHVRQASSKIDANGTLDDAYTLAKIRDLTAALVDMIEHQ